MKFEVCISFLCAAELRADLAEAFVSSAQVVFVKSLSFRNQGSCCLSGTSRNAVSVPGRHEFDQYPSPVTTGKSALLRAGEVIKVIGGKVVTPLLGSLLSQGLPEDGEWNSYWERSAGEETNADVLTNALEELGPTYVKFGQALGSRPDVVPPSLAKALSSLQDNMEPFDTRMAKDIVWLELSEQNRGDPNTVAALVECLSDKPIAAASVGQVYKATLPTYGEVAVKVQRPGIRLVVERDAALLRTLATWIESVPAFPRQGKTNSKRLVKTKILSAVDEFMSRIFEELDYRREAENAAAFARLYCSRSGTSPDVSVVVPKIFPDLCSENVLVMEWIDGSKLTSLHDESASVSKDIARENLALVKIAIRSTLSQLLDTGVLHADPHAGNLLKVDTGDNEVTLGYLDFGLLSTIPAQVRDALVCAVAQLVFANDVEAVACLFGELDLLPQEVLDNPLEREALTRALEQTMAESLVYPKSNHLGRGETMIPKLRFDKLLNALARLVPRFSFELPPYCINNARALSTLEGMAKSFDPSFNVLQVLYPYALNRMFQNPTRSPVVDSTLQSLIRSPHNGRVQYHRLKKLLSDSALLTGFRKRKVLRDVLKTSGGKRLFLAIAAEELNHKFTGSIIGRTRNRRRRSKKGSFSYFKL